MQSVPILIAAHVCSMLGFSTFAALLPQLRDQWSLSNAQAGIVGGVFFGGYISTSQLLSIPLCAIGLYVIWRNRRPGPRPIWS